MRTWASSQPMRTWECWSYSQCVLLTPCCPPQGPGPGRSPGPQPGGPGGLHRGRGLAAGPRGAPAPQRHAALELPPPALALLQAVVAAAEGPRPPPPRRAPGATGPGLLHPVPPDGAGGPGAPSHGGAASGAGPQGGAAGPTRPLGPAGPELLRTRRGPVRTRRGPVERTSQDQERGPVRTRREDQSGPGDTIQPDI